MNTFASTPLALMLFAAPCFALAQPINHDTLPVDVEQFVRSDVFASYTDLAAAYDSSVTPDLVDMLGLTSDGRERHRIAGVLGVVGDERAIDPLIALLESPHPSELTMEDQEVRREALMSLGLLVNSTGSDKALSYLIESLDPGIWRRRNVRGVSFNMSQTNYDFLLSRYAIYGLAISGHPSAREALLNLQQSPSPNQTEFRSDLNDTLTQWLEVNKLVAELGVSGMYEYYAMQRQTAQH